MHRIIKFHPRERSLVWTLDVTRAEPIPQKGELCTAIPSKEWILLPNKNRTKVEVFVGKEVREATQEGEGKHVRQLSKKARDFTDFLNHKSTLLRI